MRSWIRSSPRQFCSVEELAQRAGMSPPQILQTRPAFQQGPHQGTCDVVEPPQDLRKIQLQTIRQAIALGGLLIHHLPAPLHQKLQQPGFGGVRLQGAEAFAMPHQ
jgi:hypothetical protein